MTSRRSGWYGVVQVSVAVLGLPVATNPIKHLALVDVHDEYARHTGHADLFREAVDGLVGEDPPQP